MARPKKIEGEKPVKGVKHSEIKPVKGMLINHKKYHNFLDIYHYLRPYLSSFADKEVVTKAELIKAFPQDKQLVEDVLVCVYELKLVWPQDMMGRLFSETL